MHLLLRLTAIPLTLLTLAACSSTPTRSTPETTRAPGSMGPPTDWKNQISVGGRVLPSSECLARPDDFRIEVTGPSPGDSRVCGTEVSPTGSYRLICGAQLGKYSVLLRENRNDRIVESRRIETAATDRFEVDFHPCSENEAAML